MECDNLLKETPQIVRMKKYSLNRCYSCSGELYKLLDFKVMHSLVEKIEIGKMVPVSKLAFGKEQITSEEQFLSVLDKYIGYVRNNFLIEHNELIFILQTTLGNKYNKILYYNLDYYYADAYNIYRKCFIKMFLFNFINNIKFYSKYIVGLKSINKANEFLKDKKINNEKDLRDMEDFFKGVINNRKNNLCYCFISYKDLGKDKYRFHSSQIDWTLEDYYKLNN